ncbi:MAG: hypothetical protein J0M02_05875 [Planctomycetes bacterium]|nr:hypothetical protein [Planctomycetota bacterium]
MHTLRTILLAIALAAPAVAAEGLTITFTPTNPAGSGRWTKHIAAVWIETSGAAFVKTIANWSATQRSDLTQWRAKAGASDTDAVMGATRNSVSALTSGTWAMNSRASPSSTVADGAYRIWLEVVDDSTPSAGTGNTTFANRLGVPFQKDGVSRAAVPYADPNTKFLSITYTYTGRVPTNANPALSIVAGSSTTFTATNNATVSPSGYQWRKAGSAIAGATNATYAIAGAVVGDAGSYDCVLTYPNSYGLATAPSMTSNALTLAVSSGSVAATGLALTPAASTVNPGGAVTLTATVSPANATSPVYAWYSSAVNATSGGTLIAGQTAATYAPPTAAAGMVWYYARVTAGGSTITSSSASQVTVRAAPTISVQPSAVTVAAGGTATFTLTAADSGFPTLTYRWQSLPPAGAWTNITGATTASYATASLVDATQYRCVVTNAAGSGVATTSSAAVLTLVQAPSITADTTPLDPSDVAGATISLAVSGSVPTGTLSYRWQHRASAAGTFADVPGATAATYGATATVSGEQYRCILTNTRNAVTAATISRTTTLTVSTPAAPAFTTQPADRSVVAGSTARFTAAASGVPTPSLQWQESTDNATFTDIAGETAASYTTPATAMSDVGSPRWYRCIASNGSGSATSNAAQLTVTAAATGVAFIAFTSSPAGGSYAPKHVMAAWIQRGPTCIATVGDWSSQRKASLVLWNSVRGSTDAVMGATQLSHARVANLRWSFDPAAMPDGIYSLWLESADDNPGPIGGASTSPVAGANRMHLDFTIAGGAVMGASGAGGGFSAVTIDSVPGPAAGGAAGAASAAVEDGKVASCGSGAPTVAKRCSPGT